MDISKIKAKVKIGAFLISDHASTEAADEEISFREMREAILDGEILE